jgi:hypothetical protein
MWPPFVILLIVHTHICFVLLQDQQGTPSNDGAFVFVPKSLKCWCNGGRYWQRGVTEDVTGKEEKKEVLVAPYVADKAELDGV